ncbi:uncharacterized protein LOC110230784 isoform X1 [Arabidopsis lyrata subsp. lyrata]|uniref:uncharacterized protein LOC110230784 isoform X1 n=1 Tax=Arabidopsis lyrata subsp. lyrata TaxID=81972 RepID=UPI000A29A39E|nr:uncharacterized protein LOC110230784 isoform X1 [Arabidopsis lyrata subsp. lyrata]|eukprot:XP_020890330.1 uncharacterized protein LOC110230784 isoform X1 [Arabidopsis lyrata subsp. lyrata]
MKPFADQILQIDNTSSNNHFYKNIIHCSQVAHAVFFYQVMINKMSKSHYARNRSLIIRKGLGALSLWCSWKIHAEEYHKSMKDTDLNSPSGFVWFDVIEVSNCLSHL